MSWVATFTACAPTQSPADAERYIIEGARQWAESVATGDTTALERILADDFVGVDPHGAVYNKATMIANTKEAPKYFSSNKLGKVTVRFFGDTAVAQGDESWIRYRGDPIRGRFVWIDTWVRRSGVWQIVAAQDAIAKEVEATK
jgi:ketosteroid isomerase-like protein